MGVMGKKERVAFRMLNSLKKIPKLKFNYYRIKNEKRNTNLKIAQLVTP